MLKLRWRRRAPRPDVHASLHDRPDLRIRNLLDDPRLRRSMGLDEPDVDVVVRPEPRFDRRRLLDDRAA
jgi:hypothetical protein